MKMHVICSFLCTLAALGTGHGVLATAATTADFASPLARNNNHGGGYPPHFAYRSLQATSNSSIMDHLNADPAEFAIFTSLLGKANLDQVLASSVTSFGGNANYTLFAPTNSAFESLLGSLPAEVGQAILGDVNLITKIASYHLVDGFYNAAQLLEMGEVETTFENWAVSFTADDDDDGLLVNGYTISVVDIVGSNGIIHVISDGVLLPPSLLQVAAMKGTLSRLGYLMELTGLNATLDSVLAGITLLAPADDAFGRLSSDLLSKLVSDSMWQTHLLTILAYHVLVADVPTEAILDDDGGGGGGNLTMASWLGEMIEFTTTTDDNRTATILVNGEATVTEADITALNGRMHIIDKVLLPDWVETSIVDLITSDPDLAVLLDLIVEAGIVELLSGEGAYTVFAPKNEAFVDIIPTLTTERSNASASEAVFLVDAMLRYHVVEGIYSSNAIADGLILTTLLGENITFSIVGDAATINEGTTEIVEANVFANNGIIHKLNGVLIPQVVLDATTTDSPTQAPTVTRTTDTPTSTPVTDGGVEITEPSTEVAGTASPTLMPVASFSRRYRGTVGIVLAILTTASMPFL